MKLLLPLGLALCCVCLVSSQSTPTEALVIKPPYPKMWILAGDQLSLECQYTGNAARDNSIDFFRGPTKVNREMGFVITESIIPDPDTLQDMKVVTITKTQVTTSDKGVFQCRFGDTLTADITIDIVTLEPSSSPFVEKAPEVNLTCSLMHASTDIQGGVTVDWKKGNATVNVGLDTRFKAHAPTDTSSVNGIYTLVISEPVRDDAGQYTCVFVFPGDSGNIPDMRLAPKPALLTAPPMIDSHDNNKNLVEGERLELKCMVSGYPVPSLAWKKDNTLVNTSDSRFHVFPYGPASNGKLIVYALTFDDKGDYSCTASAVGFNATVTENMTVRVKDKLAALWPFLGIVAEVIILCVIIFIYEKRRSKNMSDEDDSPDTNVEKASDNTDVRHRRA